MASTRFQLLFSIIIVLLQSFSFSLAEDEICVGKPFGSAIEDLTDCTGYFECIFGEAEHQNCPAGEKFDVNTESCIVGKCPPCKCDAVPTAPSPIITTEDPTSSSSESPTSTESSQPTIPTESSSISTEVPSSSETSPSPGTECSNEPYCQSSEHGTFHRDRKDCGKFYVCKNGEAIAHTCRYGMYFDEVINACNFASLVPCFPSTNDNCTPKPTESSSSAPSTEPPTTSSSSEPTSTEASTESSSASSTTSESTTISTESSSISTEVTASSGTSTPPGTECSNEPYCQASEHGTFHRDRKDCGKFYVCRNGEAIAHTCSYGMYFDEVVNACNFASLVPCSPSTNENCTPIPTESSSSTEPPITSFSSEASTSLSTESSSASPTTPESSSTECSDEPYCQASEHGTFHRDRNDCRKYYVCRNGIAVPHFCNKGMYFDDVAYVCNYASLVQCAPNENCITKSTKTPSSSVTSSTPRTECSTEPNCQLMESLSFHRDKKDCRKYYICLNGSPMALVCAPGEYFDDVAKVCKLESYVICTSGTDENCEAAPSSTALTSSTSATTKQPPAAKPSCPPEPDCKVEPHGSIHRDPRDCSKFSFCRNGVAVTRSCRKGEHFDLNINACRPWSLVNCRPIESCLTPKSSSPVRLSVILTPTARPTSTTLVPNGQVNSNITDCLNLPNRAVFRDSVHCNVFYICRNQKAVKHSCPYHQWFDDQIIACNFRNLVNCPSGMD